MSEVRAALEGLQTHPGWQLFLQEAKRRWGAVGYARELKKAIGVAIQNNQSPDAAIRAVDFANDEINSLLTWVDTAARHAAYQDAQELEPQGQSRRGPNL